MKVTFLGTECKVEFLKYADNDRVAIRLICCDDSAIMAMATVNLPGVNLKKDQVCIKDYSENRGMLKVLVEAKIVEDTGLIAHSGFVTVPICKVICPVEA